MPAHPVLIQPAHPRVHVPVRVHDVVTAAQARRGAAKNRRRVDGAKLRKGRENKVIEAGDVRALVAPLQPAVPGQLRGALALLDAPLVDAQVVLGRHVVDLLEQEAIHYELFDLFIGERYCWVPLKSIQECRGQRRVRHSGSLCRQVLVHQPDAPPASRLVGYHDIHRR